MSGLVVSKGDVRAGKPLFVYGTLRRDECRANVLDVCRREGPPMWRMPNAKMIDLKAYPGVVRSNEGTSVVGEVYYVDTEDLWQRLDRIEGVPTLYRCEQATVFPDVAPDLAKLHALSVYVYLYQGKYGEGSFIESGDWLDKGQRL